MPQSKGRIPEEEIEEIKRVTDLAGLIGAGGVELRQKGVDLVGHCPFHDDRTPSLIVTPEKGLWHCMGACQMGGSAIDWVMKTEKVGFREAVNRLAQGVSDPGKERKGSAVRNGQVKQSLAVLSSKQGTTAPAFSPEELTRLLANVFKRFQSHFTQSSAAIGYLIEKRGLAHVNEIEAGFCPRNFATLLEKGLKAPLVTLGILDADHHPRFGDCVVFPLRDPAGEITGFYGRKIRGTGTHYYLPGEREGIFSIHDGSEVQCTEPAEVYLTESVIDALSLNHIGITSVLALHGVNGFTKVHEGWLASKKIKTVYLVLDGDRAGREASAKLKSRLEEKGYIAHNIELPDGMDPNSFLLASKNKKDLEALPGYPTPPDTTGHSLTHQGEELIFKTQERSYTIKGLAAQGLDRLRVTLKCTSAMNPGYFHIDQLDLYAARPRASFIEGVVKEMAADTDKVTSEIKALITALEKERLKEAKGKMSQVPEIGEEQKGAAIELLKKKTLFNEYLLDLERLGYVGDEKAKKLALVVSLSRLLPKPLGLLVISRSGAGKSTLQEMTCLFVPDENLLEYTRVTGQALFYHGEDGLKNKVLSIEEVDGAKDAQYSLRTLQSSQRLSTGSTRTDPKTGKLKADRYRAEGPVSIMFSSTDTCNIDPETRSRFVIATIDESSEQTERIFSAQCEIHTASLCEQKAIREKWQNAQRCLRTLKVNEGKVMSAYIYPTELLQYRRERQKYRTLLHTIALLRQYQKKVYVEEKNGVKTECIDADATDVALANELALEFFTHSLDELAPHTRKLGELAGKMCEERGDSHFTRKELRDYSGWTNYAVCQALSQLMELEYIAQTGGQNGVLYKYRLLIDPRKESRRVFELTCVKELEKKLEKKISIGGKVSRKTEK